MRPLSAEDEATLRAIAERHGFYAARGPHTGEGSVQVGAVNDDLASLTSTGHAIPLVTLSRWRHLQGVAVHRDSRVCDGGLAPLSPRFVVRHAGLGIEVALVDRAETPWPVGDVNEEVCGSGELVEGPDHGETAQRLVSD